MSLGVVITVLCLAFDPFMQQLLNYPLREVGMLSSRAAVKQSVSFFLDSNRDGRISDDYLTAINAGIWTKEFAVIPSCPSGNCTWPLFDSEGLCTQCEDVTASATLEVAMTPFDYQTPRAQQANCSVNLSHGRPGIIPMDVVNISPDTCALNIPEHVIWSLNNPVPTHETEEDVHFGIEAPISVIAHVELSWPEDITDGDQPAKNISIKKAAECVMSKC